jgi:hypothetical protein
MVSSINTKYFDLNEWQGFSKHLTLNKVIYGETGCLNLRWYMMNDVKKLLLTLGLLFLLVQLITLIRHP